MDTGIGGGPTQRATFGTGGADADDLESRLSGLEGVRNVSVNGDQVEVEYDPTVISQTQLQSNLESGGDGGGDAGGDGWSPLADR